MTREIYLDNNATTQVLPQASDAMMEVLGAGFGNPSSAHRAGEKTRRVLFAARNRVSQLFDCLPENILFGSGATELNNWILTGVCDKPDAHLITSEVEHSSVLRVAEHLATKGVRVTYLPVDRQGLVDLDELKDSITSRTALVSVQLVNGDTGVIQDIETMASICGAAGIKLHCDAAQAVGKIEVKVSKLQVDFLTCSAHKLHGPTLAD